MDKAVDKAPDAFRTISEVADDLDLPQHVLRFWETRFIQIRPMKRGGGRRFYRREDVELLRGIRHLLYGEGYTIRGVQRILKDHGVKFVQSVWQAGAPQPDKAHTEEEAADTAAEPRAPERTRRLFGLLSSRQADVDANAAPPAPPLERLDTPTDAGLTRKRMPAPLAEIPVVPHERGATGSHEPVRTPGRGGLGGDDLRKLKATLHDLEECRRLIDEGLDTAP